ncbi:unnamed protein product [Protopolystoma xenopodis]|uniref:Uncharacterized protein n=1 Tax=Protopolystoma xenopodis TaxID=117903 RepID=A0A3S5AP87_9PLAT|nr:unnamed protein product [Protopolystoma xenopodis]
MRFVTHLCYWNLKKPPSDVKNYVLLPYRMQNHIQVYCRNDCASDFRAPEDRTGVKCAIGRYLFPLTCAWGLLRKEDPSDKIKMPYWPTETSLRTTYSRGKHHVKILTVYICALFASHGGAKQKVSFMFSQNLDELPTLICLGIVFMPG